MAERSMESLQLEIELKKKIWDMLKEEAVDTETAAAATAGVLFDIIEKAWRPEQRSEVLDHYLAEIRQHGLN